MMFAAAVLGAFGILAYVVLARVLDYRNLLLFAVVCTIPLRNQALLTIAGANVRFGDVFLVAAVAVFLLELLVDPRGLRSFSWLHIVLISFVLWSAVTVAWSLDPSFGAVRAFKYLRNLSMFLLIAHWTHGRFATAFRTVVQAMAASFVYIIPIVLQRVAATGITLASLVHPADVGLMLNQLRGSRGISGGTFAQGGTVLALASWTLVAIFLWLGLAYWRSPRLSVRLLFWVVLIAMSAIEFVTFSRGAWGALALAGVWWFVRIGRALPRRTRLVAIVVVLLGAGFAVSVGLHRTIIARVTSVAAVANPDEDASIDLRRLLWSLARQQLREHPLGIGLGATTQAIAVHTGNVWFIHNLYLQLLTELGPPGLALALAAFGICVRRLTRAARRPVDRSTRVAAVALIGAFLAYLIMAFIDFDMTEMEIWVLFGVTIGVPLRGYGRIPVRRAPASIEQPVPAPS